MPHPDTDRDVAIVGAGPAGSAAAIALARAGRRVVVVERHIFPREKVCGGCLSGTGTRRLHELLGPQQRAPGRPSTSITFVMGAYRLTCRPHGATWMVPRSELDACLAATAVEAGAEIRFGTPATLELEGERWVLRVGDEPIRAQTVLIAAGLSGLGRKIGIAGRPGARPMLAQQWVQPANAALPRVGEVELHWLRGGYIGLATPRAEQCVVALAADASDLAGQSAFERLRDLNPRAAIMGVLPPDAPRQFAARGTAGFPWLPTRLGDRNVLLVGDAAGYAEPYSGEGIGQALGSAACAARAILEGGDVCRTYTRLMSRSHRGVFWRTRLISRILQQSLVHTLVTRWPLVPDAWLTQLVARVHVGSAV